MKYLALIVMGLYLAIISVEDIRKKMIDLKILLCGFAFVPAYILIFEEISIADRLLGTVPGIVLFICSLVTKGGIGHGDIMEILSLGLSLGIAGITMILAAAFIAVGLFSGIMLARGRLKIKSRVPFIPFLFLGFVFMSFMIRI